MTNKIKNWTTNNRSSIIAFFIFLFIFLFMHGERILNNFSKQGSEIPVVQYETHTGSKITFPVKEQRAILLFWATWCAPCKVEMERLKKSASDGKINAQSIFLINPFEEKDQILFHLKKNPYPFQFLIDENQFISRKLNITQTPTMLLLNGTKIEHMSSGISLTGILQAELFLSKTL